MKDLQAAVRLELTRKGITLIEFYRRGTFGVEVLFKYTDSYWTMKSKIDKDEEKNQSDINEMLYYNLMNVQLPAVLKKIEEKKEK